MKSFWVDFCGYCCIEAETKEEANDKFWQYVKEGKELPENAYGIECVEEREAGE